IEDRGKLVDLRAAGHVRAENEVLARERADAVRFRLAFAQRLNNWCWHLSLRGRGTNKQPNCQVSESLLAHDEPLEKCYAFAVAAISTTASQAWAGMRKILPSPMRPVRATSTILRATSSARRSSTHTVISTLGKNVSEYSVLAYRSR